ncbi:BLUF domain-containing protein [Aureimonas jatrophae]|uniref:BLUF domain-containing protein n=1 Tax=Aureimonas jatrophae TaxID=1166073 RepID=UPI000B824096|nr:BLUF domain-containing protein [Aureimonas jatrophae]MBB3953006.1 hypothetical protein [Aureimonas jatrophae]
MNTADDALVRLVYSSSIAPGVTAQAVTDIVRVSTERNRASGITGMLALDGTRVCQILEGPHDTVVALRHHSGRSSPLGRRRAWSEVH